MKFDLRHGILLAATVLTASVGHISHAQLPADVPITYQGEIWINQAPLADGTYDIAVDFVTSDTSPASICGATATQSVEVLAGRFTIDITDGTCRRRLATADQPVWIRVRGSGGDLGTSPVDLGFQKVSAGVYTLRSHSGGMGIGDIIVSVLDPTDFATVHGDGWVLADGGDATGTAYASLTGNLTLPDLRGLYLRGHKGTPARPDPISPSNDIYSENTALAGYQTDQLRSHAHSVAPTAGPVGGSVDMAIQGSNTPQKAFNSTTGDFGSAETRPKTAVINYYIRVN